MQFSETYLQQPKKREVLKQQLKSAQSIIGKRPEHALALLSEKQADILKMPLDEIKRRYGRRYEIYLQLLRKQGKTLSENELNEMRKWLKALNSLDRYIEKHRMMDGKRVLRERQFTAYEDLRNFIERGGMEGYIKMPPRVGKTVLFTEFIEALNFPKILIVTSRKLLITQVSDEILKHAPQLNIGKIYTNAKEYGSQVTITSYNSLVDQVENGNIRPEEYNCLILDEAHRALSQRRQEIVKRFANALIIGFTATPTFSTEKNLKKFLGTEIHTMDIREGVEEGLLCPFSSFVAKSKTNLTNVRITGKGEYNASDLEKAINNKARNISTINLYKKMFDGEKAIAFCVGIQHSLDMAAEFRSAGVPAAAIYGKVSEKRQNELKRKLSTGEILVLCNADILIEGVDIPQASVCLNTRPTRSRVVAEQRARVLTLDENKPNKHAFIVDFLDEGLVTNPPILFAQIAGGAEIKTKIRPDHATTTPYLPKKHPIINVEGLEVVTDAEEVMRVVSGLKARERTVPLPFEEFLRQIRVANITSEPHYKRIQKMHPGWPAIPEVTYKGKWPGYIKALGREKLSLEQLKIQVSEHQVKTYGEYRERRKAHPRWPANPDKSYPEWKKWEDLLGPRLLSYQRLIDELLSNKIFNPKVYKSEYKKHRGWPADPSDYYTEWKGWKKFRKEHGVSLKFLPFNELKSQLRKYNITTMDEYKKERGSHPDWPKYPHHVYKEWRGRKDFFGKNKEIDL